MSVNYSTPDTKAWAEVSDSLFLAQFRGRSCEICGATSVKYQNRTTRSCGHHLANKSKCRQHRYNPMNIMVLCAEHHCRHSGSYSPHTGVNIAVADFYDFLRQASPDKYAWFKQHARDSWDNSFTYKEMYVRLGGQITEGLKKNQKPLNHAAAVKKAEAGR